MGKRDSIWNANNPYGYKINVNHPDVRPFYDYYKSKLGLKILSDSQRLTFETLFLRMQERKNHE